MKKKLFLALTVSAVILGGCSKGPKADYGVRDGVIFNGNKTVSCTMHKGYAAEGVLQATGDKISITWHNNFDDCGNNSAGVMSTDVVEDGDFSYFAMYLGTEYTVHQEKDKHMNCAYLRMSQETAQDSAIVLQSIENQMKDLILSDEFNTCTLDDKVYVTGVECEARSSGLTVPGQFVVQKGTVQTTSTVDVGEVTVGFISNEGYDYYQFGEYVVKAVAGYDISPYVTFVEAKR